MVTGYAVAAKEMTRCWPGRLGDGSVLIIRGVSRVIGWIGGGGDEGFEVAGAVGDAPDTEEARMSEELVEDEVPGEGSNRNSAQVERVR